MAAFLSKLNEEYVRLQTRFGEHLLGIVEIGSFAHNEAVQFSDHDLRLIIHCDAVTTIDWQELTQHSDLTFGLTNLAYIERALESGRYPLVDHTALYQGRILLDDTGTIRQFQAHYADIKFANIVPDYLLQTEWRATMRLARELTTLSKQLDHQKYAIQPIHTCYRIIRDMANIANYHEYGVYLNEPIHIAGYYRDEWPWFESIFQTLRAFKTDEILRQTVFNEVVQQVPARISQIRGCIEATTDLWSQFRKQYEYTTSPPV